MRRPLANFEGARGRRRATVELILGYGLIVLVLWTPRPFQQAIYVAAAGYLAAVTALRYRGLAAMRVRRGNLLRASWVLAAAIPAAALTFLWASRRHGVHLPGGGAALFHRYWGYAVWAFLQQVLLQDFFLRRLERLLPGRAVLAALAAAAIFGAAHLPNPILAPVTLAWGFAACLLFQRYRNLWPLALTHALFGITLSCTMPPSLVRGMHVGLGYLHRG